MTFDSSQVLCRASVSAQTNGRGSDAPSYGGPGWQSCAATC